MDFGTKLQLLEARMVESVTSNMNSNMQQLMAVVSKLSAPDNTLTTVPNLASAKAPEPDPSSILRDQVLYNANEIGRAHV